MREMTGDALFHWRTCYYGLWTLCILVKNVLMLDLFHLLSSPDVNWWTGVVWIIVMFYQTLILTAPIHCIILTAPIHCIILTAPIHCRASIAETLRHISTNLMKKQTHPDLRWTHSQHILGNTVTKHYEEYLFRVLLANMKRVYIYIYYNILYIIYKYLCICCI